MGIDKLTDAKIRTAKPSAKEYNLGDGGGLSLRVKPSGTKIWVFNYYRPSDKRRSNASFGVYPDVTLSVARERRREARGLLAQDIDPQTFKVEQQEAARAKQAREVTFAAIAKQWFELHKHEVARPTATKDWRMLETYVLPFIGGIPVTEIRASKVIEVLRPIEADGLLSLVGRLCQRINRVLNYAVNHDSLQSNPCAAIGKVFKKAAPQNHPTIEPSELPQLMADIAAGSLEPATRCQILWSLHTLVRPSESAGAMWDEIDIENKVWIIPAERMKMDRPHRVPLTPQAIAVLEQMRPLSGHRTFVFPGHRDPTTHINKQSANAALKRLGYGGRLVSHGLRSLGSTTLNEQGFNPDAIEAALSHTDTNKIRRAYNRSDYFEQREPMMGWWSEHIELASQGIITLGGGFRGLRVVGD